MRLATANLLLLLAPALAAPAWAEPPARCRVRSIHALDADGGVDKKIAKLRPLLGKPPFDRFKSFKLIKEDAVDAEIGRESAVEVPSGKKLVVTFLERVKGDKKPLLRVKLDYGGVATTYRVGEGDPIPLVVGAHAGGTLVLAVDCASKKK
ncbi:MAG: hypothetical protein AABZ30_09870 [Myxococcota bacterium]